MATQSGDNEALTEHARWLLFELDTRDGIQLASSGSGGGLKQANPRIKKAWRYLRNELADLMCTKSVKYREKRHTISNLERSSFLALGSYLTAHFGIEHTAAAGLVTLASAIPAEMGIRAWCEAYREAQTDDDGEIYLRGERAYLLKMADFKTDLFLKDESKKVNALHKLASNQLIDAELIPILITLLHDDSASVRGATAYALMKSGVIARAAVPNLVECLKDTHEWVRSHSASALGNFPEAAPIFLDELIATLRDKKQRVREDAADALQRLGVASQTILSELKQALRDDMMSNKIDVKTSEKFPRRIQILSGVIDNIEEVLKFKV